MIPNDFDTAYAEVKQLIEAFSADITNCTRPEYSEARVRMDYIDKFFIALGWDVTHKVQRNSYKQEVKVEPSVTVAERTKKADYSFSLAPNFRDVHFFVEAKKPFGTLDTPDNCFQTIRYGYSSSRAAVSILTNFKEIVILDCRYRPDIETAPDRIVKRFAFTDFLNFEEFSKVYHLFGRDAVESGSLEEYAKTLPKPKGREKQLKLFADGHREVDNTFLAMLEEFREDLAKMFKRKNQTLNSDDLTEAVQRTLDRLIFIRFLEDKLIEPNTILDKFGFDPNAWRQFIAKCAEFNRSYNGIIFKEHLIDSPDFLVDDKVFLKVCDDLASDHTPYHFNYIPIHILGSIYERFLGNVIVATAKQARIEAKPEVRKAGGVFYTPQYIVKYIVENTVGKLLEKKTPKDVEEMRFADIACGSGSFLLGVYEYLLAWHTEYYNKKGKEKEAKAAHCIPNEDGTFHLSFEQKSDILVNNVYGVDIDRQAHEVTQLSLFLKLLEEETLATKRKLWDTERKAMLPSLANNIICGNALVDWDISSGDLFEQVDQEKEKRLNPMSFESKFPAVMRNGGFDAIVGNPPYIRIQVLKETMPEAVKYYNRKYRSAGVGSYDLYVVFLEKARSLLNEGGKLGYIVPHKFFNAQYGAPVRSILAEGRNLAHIVHFGAEQVFDNATTYTCLLFLNHDETDQFEFVTVNDLSEWRASGRAISGFISSSLVTSNEWNFVVGSSSELFHKLRGLPATLGDVADIFVGLQTSADDVYILDYISENGSNLILKSSALDITVEVEREMFFPIVSGTDVKAYNPLPNRQYVLFPYDISHESPELISLTTISKEFPKTFNYLKANRKRLENREKGKFRDNSWHRFGRNQNIGIQNLVKICVPRLVEHLNATFDFDGSHFLDNVDVGGLTLKRGVSFASEDLRFLLGLLNSRLFGWYFPFVSAPFRGGFRSANRQFLSQLPLCHLNLPLNTDEKAKHDLIVRAVEQIMDAKAKLAAAKNDSERQHLTDKCEKFEIDINNAVYSLYGLTSDEIKLVEDS